MSKIITYHMSDDIFKGIDAPGLNNIRGAVEIIESLSEEDFNDLMISNIYDDILAKAKKISDDKKTALQNLDDFLHFFYTSMSSYEIKRDDNGVITGEVTVCLD